MDGMDSLLGQPVNAMASFMGSSKMERPDDNSGFSQFDPYGSFGNSSASMDPSMAMLSNLPMNDMGISSASNSEVGASNNRFGDQNAMSQIMLNPLGTPNSSTDLSANPISQSVDSLGLGFNDGSNNGQMQSMMDPSAMQGAPMGPGNSNSGPIGPVPDMSGGGPSQGGVDGGSVEMSNMMKQGNSMSMGQPGDHYNMSMQGPVGMGGNPGGEYAPNMASVRNMNPQGMSGPGMPMDMYAMGPPMGMQQPNMGQQPPYMNGAMGMGAAQMIDPSQLPASALSSSGMAPVTKRPAANGRKKAQPRANAPKKAAAQPRNPRGPRNQQNKAAAVSTAVGTPVQTDFSTSMAAQPQNQLHASPSMNNTSHPQTQYPLQMQPPAPAGVPLNRPPSSREGPMNMPNSQGYVPQTGPLNAAAAAKLPMRQFEFASQQPPPPRASGVLKLRVQFVLTLNQELLKLLIASGLGSPVSGASISRLESNLQYLRQVHSQHDISSALAVQPPILSPIVEIPSLSEPYRRLADMFKIKPMPAQP